MVTVTPPIPRVTPPSPQATQTKADWKILPHRWSQAVFCNACEARVCLGWKENHRYANHEEMEAGVQEDRLEWRTVHLDQRVTMGKGDGWIMLQRQADAWSQLLPRSRGGRPAWEWGERCRQSYLIATLQLGSPLPSLSGTVSGLLSGQKGLGDMCQFSPESA